MAFCRLTYKNYEVDQINFFVFRKTLASQIIFLIHFNSYTLYNTSIEKNVTNKIFCLLKCNVKVYKIYVFRLIKIAK